MLTKLQQSLIKAINFDPSQHTELLPFVSGIELTNDQVVISLIVETRNRQGDKIELDTEKDIITSQAQFVDSDYNQETKTWRAFFDLGDKKELVLKLAKYNQFGDFVIPFDEPAINSKKDLIQTWHDYIAEVDKRKAEKLEDIEKTELEIRRMKDENIVYEDVIIEAKKQNLL